ncbi:aldose 1-epimerase family protein [Sciscionella sediminilitoris]|uniref:aldose 1-epimerase family protein n=1 Tax=Sciscionella sediminilitoris TaxID=1445613 RepID=UPI0004DF194C|nr:aldose 1-epimerase family protein [Sciscionella sp. SE31]
MNISRRAALTTAMAAGATVAGASAASASAQQPVAAQAKQVGENGAVYRLRRGSHEAVITGVAAALYSWKVDGEEILATHDPRVMGEAGYQGKTILPWCNRIAAGKYTFEGTEYQVPINEVAKNTALHGLLNFVEWELVHHDGHRLVLEYTEPPSYGYPFHLRFRIGYTMDRDGLQCTLSARNIGTTNAPFTTATHIYVAAPPGGHVDDLVVELPAASYYLVDDNLIPTGKAAVAGTEYDFRAPRKIGAQKLDTAFTDVTTQNGRSHAIVRRPGSVDIELWMDAGHNYYQMYSDDSPSIPRPKRIGLALEPMVGAPNAFNTGDGLITIAPGSAWEGSWGLRAV